MSDAAGGERPAAGVAVVGGGWAGWAAAVTLAAAGVRVAVYEQAKTLGGRARRVALDGLALDNGQHLLVGAYRQTQELVARVHSPDGAAALFRRLPLVLRPFGAADANAVTLAAWRAPAPLHLAGAMLATRGLTWAERFGLIADYRRLARAGFRCAPATTVAECFAHTPPRAFAAIWAPLCLAALNTPTQTASAQLFANVLRAALSSDARCSDFLVPAVDLSGCFPDAAARFVVERSGTVRLGVSVRGVARRAEGVALDVGSGHDTHSAAIVAVGPHQLAPTLGAAAAGADPWSRVLAQVNAFAYESITTIYLGFPAHVPFAVPILRLDDAPGHWAFDRSSSLVGHGTTGIASVVAVVISAGGPHDHLDHATLVKIVEAQLRRLRPTLPPVTWSRVIAERRATYACTPMLSRPAHGRVSDGVYLAGDYTDREFPATLEAAVRSGIGAATALLADRVAQRA